MPRMKSREKYHIFFNKSSPCWYVWYISDESGKKVLHSTFKRRDEYTKEQVQRFVDNETGTKQISQNSINWLEENTLYRLELEGRAEKTIKLYKIAFRYLKAIYGGGYSVYKIERSAIFSLQRYLHENSTRNTGINTYLRTLHAAFEHLVINGGLDKNPFHRFNRLPVPKNKKQHMTYQEAKHFLEMVNKSKNDNAKHLTRILLFTGIRRSELLLIEREDVNMSEMFYRAVNIKSENKHKVWRPIPDEVFHDFEYFMNESESALPFKVCHPDTLTHWVKKLLREAEFSEDLHCHSLRHTFITLGLETESVSLREMQKYIDHSSIKVTEGYAHEKQGKVPNIGLV